MKDYSTLLHICDNARLFNYNSVIVLKTRLCVLLLITKRSELSLFHHKRGSAKDVKRYDIRPVLH